MQAIQHEQSLFADPAFPVSLHQDELDATRRSVYTNWHASIELLYGLEGRARVLLDSEEVFFGAGQMVVIGRNVLHTIYADTERCLYHCLIVSSDFLSGHGFDMEGAGFSGVAEDPELMALFERVVLEHESSGALRRPAVLAAVLTMFVRLFRAYARREPMTKRHMERNYPLTVMEALHYIRVHLLETIHIDDVSRHVGMSKYYFCRLFREYTGTSVLHYINMLRCDYARRLISESGYNVAQAAHKLGINNLSYFSRLFKRHTGYLPSHFRPARAKKPSF